MEREAHGWVSRSLGAGEAGGGQGARTARTATGGGATFIDQGAVFEGRLRATGTLRVDGELRGEIVAETLVVGEAAGVEAHIEARSVMVSGAIAGRIEASREVVLRPTARLQADVDAPSLVVERGAVLNGQTRMLRPELRARAEAAGELPARREAPPEPTGAVAAP